MGMRTIAEVVGAPSVDLLLLLGTSAQEKMSQKWRKTVLGCSSGCYLGKSSGCYLGCYSGCSRDVSRDLIGVLLGVSPGCYQSGTGGVTGV